jgi:pilus assembly protein Flp/PilA
MLSQLVKFQARIAALRSERGATAVEYGLMVALIAGAIIVIVGTVGGQLNAVFADVSGKLAAAV